MIVAISPFRLSEDEVDNFEPVPEKGATFVLAVVLLLFLPPNTLYPSVLLLFGPTGAACNSCFGKQQDKHVPISAKRLTCGGIVLPRRAHTRAFAK